MTRRAASPPESSESWVTVEHERPFGKSWLWGRQVAYYAARGVNAWRRDGVPLYVTSNPVMAHAYAGLIRAWLEERRRWAPDGGRQPVTVVELGAGSGTFGFQLLAELHRSCCEGGFRYVMTDVAERNVEFWLGHPRLQPYFRAGLLDVGLLDIRQPGPVELRCSGERLLAGDAGASPVVVANYVLDSVPQDLFFLDGGSLHETRSSIVCRSDPDVLPAAEVIGHLLFRFATSELPSNPYAEPYLRRILDWYVDHMRTTHLLVPAAAIRWIESLRSLGDGRLLLLAADKGHHRAECLDAAGPPVVVHHGSFSIDVNFHALGMHCTNGGGTALFPGPPAPAGVTIACLAYGTAAEEVGGVSRAYDRLVRDFGPDDCYRVLRAMTEQPGSMDLGDLLALVRLARYDPVHFLLLVPRLRELAPTVGPFDREALVSTIERVSDRHFPLGGDSPDLDFELGALCYLAGDFGSAHRHFAQSVTTGGASTGAFFNMAACLEQMGRPADAFDLLDVLLEHDPANADAQAMLARVEAQASSLGAAAPGSRSACGAGVPLQ